MSRLTPGRIYLITIPDKKDEFWVGVFKEIFKGNGTSYTFIRIANSRTGSSCLITANPKDFEFKEITSDDLPLYLSGGFVSPKVHKLLADKSVTRPKVKSRPLVSIYPVRN